MKNLEAFAQLCEDGKVIAGIKEVSMERDKEPGQREVQGTAQMIGMSADGRWNGSACRPSGRETMLERAQALRRQADQLEVLANCIPNNFPADADEALYRLVPGR